MDVDEALRERLGTRHVDAPLFGIIRSKNLSCLTSMFRMRTGAHPRHHFFVVHTGCAVVRLAVTADSPGVAHGYLNHKNSRKKKGDLNLQTRTPWISVGSYSHILHQ